MALLVVVVLIAAAGYTAWQLYRVQRDVEKAKSSADQLIAAVRDGDATARQRALDDFSAAAADTHDHTDGAWWGVMTHVPFVGDDAEGVQVLGRVLDDVAGSGVAPLINSLDDLDGLVSDGKIDLDALERVREPVTQAHETFAMADREVSSLDSDGYSGVLRPRFEKFADQLGEVDGALASAATAVDALPSFLGADGPRTYLVVFQNNAEARALGGIPGSWAQVSAVDGKIEIVSQGTGAQFGDHVTSVLPLSEGEDEVYSDLLGRFFQDATYTPDFPRAADLMRARWEEDFPTKLDGVISLDPVALSYMLDGTGPIKVGNAQLTSANAVEQLLNAPYLRFDNGPDQDAFFASAAREIFRKATSEIRSPIALARGLIRAADEGRFLVAPYAEPEKDILAGSQVLGDFGPDTGSHPGVFVGVNDGTGSKMTYYLRYTADVTAQSCQGDTQTLLGSMTLRQTVGKAEAAALPPTITGGGNFGIPPGEQLLVLRIYGPSGGTVSDVKIDGTAIPTQTVELDGRPVTVVAPYLDDAGDSLVTWTMQTGPGQTGYGSVGVTPSVVPGDKDSSFASAC